MTQLFQSFVLTSLLGTALALILLIIRPATRRVFSAGWHYYMWLAVLAVMLLPVRFTLPEIAKHTDAQSVISAVTEAEPTQNQTISVAITAPETEPQPVAMPIMPSGITLAYIWLAGAIVFFLIKSAGYGIFLRKLRKYSVPVTCPELSLYTSRKVRVRISNKINSPLITGVFRPTLLLPDIAMDKEQLHNILSHEMMHLKRYDILYKWLVTMTKCVHWFNPMAYFIAHLIDADCEISCDMAVVRNMTGDEKKTYMETILSLLTHNSGKPSPLTTGMTGDKKTLKKRFVMIKNGRKFSKKSVIISAISAVVILAGVLFAGGILNGKYVNSITTDKPVSEDFNLLFVGVDKGSRPDTIMLIKCSESSIHGISIPRNTRFADRKLSDIWASGGVQAVIDTVRQRLNTPIHYYAKLNLDGVTELIDALGGIEFYVPMDMQYSDPYQDLNINLKEGYFTLTGDGVKQLLQFRPGNSTHGDLTRIDIHQQFIKSFAKRKITAENLEKSQQILRILAENLETNFPVHSLKNNTALLTAVQNNSITLETISGTASTYNGMPVYELTSEISFAWPMESTDIANGFGTRTHPITGEVKTHNGVDIRATKNAQVYSAISGTVTETGYDTTYGYYVVIENDMGIRTYYGHLADILVEKDATVEQKSVIAIAGKTGQATGTNLHFEIMENGTYLNPEELLKSYNEYHENIDTTVPTSVINGFFKAFESGDYGKMREYCTISCQDKYFVKNDYGDVFNVFGMSMAKLRSLSEPEYLKGEQLMAYIVNVSCKTPQSFSIIQSKNTFRVYVKKQEDNSYIIYDLSY